jgi:hypothetical protein
MRGQLGHDIDIWKHVASQEDCCALCWANEGCHAADFSGRTCHLKGDNSPIERK